MWFQHEIEERVEGRIRSFFCQRFYMWLLLVFLEGIRTSFILRPCPKHWCLQRFRLLYNILHKDVEQEILSQATLPFGPRVFCRFGKVLGRGYGVKRAKTFRAWYILAQYVVLRGENAASTSVLGIKRSLSISRSINQPISVLCNLRQNTQILPSCLLLLFSGNYCKYR